MFIPESAKPKIRKLILQYFKSEFERNLKIEQKRLQLEKAKKEEEEKLITIKKQIEDIYTNK